jgi:hypothetical protein
MQFCSSMSKIARNRTTVQMTVGMRGDGTPRCNGAS